MCVAGGVNAALAVYLFAVGRRTGSVALVADARHVLSDVWTSAGVLVGLVAARATGWLWLDPVTAIAVALHLGYVALSIVWRAGQGLMDSAERATLERIADALEESRTPSWVDVHSLRAWRSGDVHHVDLHLVAPRFFSVEDLHRMGDALEARCPRALRTRRRGHRALRSVPPARLHELRLPRVPGAQPSLCQARALHLRATRADLPI
jgi:cation diffusion facilitator family transporter